MPIFLVLYGSWPLATYLYARFRHRRPRAAAFGTATLALLASFFVGVTIGDLHAVLAQRQPGSLQTELLFALEMVWFFGPYVAVGIWWVRRLFRPRRESPNT
jgi:hypothetical protein